LCGTALETERRARRIPTNVPPTILPPQLRTRVLASARARPAAPRRAWVPALGVLAVAASIVSFGVQRGPRPILLVAFASATAGVSALALTRLTYGGKTMLGPSVAALRFALLAAVPLFLLYGVAAAEVWPVEEPPPAHRHGGCFAIAIAQSLVPFAVLAFARRAADPVHPALTGAIVGVTAGAWGATMAYLRCPVAATLHVAVAHIGPIALLAAFGALVGARVVRPRRHP